MLIDSNHHKLTTSQIIIEGANNIPDNKYSHRQILASILAEAKMPHVRLIREGNTLFIVHKSDVHHVAMFRALNADTPHNYLKNSEVFTKAMWTLGFDFMVSYFEDPAIIHVFNWVSKHPFHAGMALKIDKMDNGEYRAIVQLGPERGGV